MSSGLEDFVLFLYDDQKSTSAIAVGETEDSEWIWLPRSQIEYVEIRNKPGYIEVTMPEWLAKEKGLI